MKQTQRSWLRKLITAVLIVSSVMLSGLVLLSFFAPASWILELLTHFRLQFSSALFIIFLGWLCIKREVPALLIGLVFLLNTVLLVPFYLPTSWVAAATMESNRQTSTSYRVLFSNFNYGNTQFDKLTALISETHPDVVITVEMPLDHYESLKPLLADYPYSFHVKRGERLGTAIFSTLPFVQEPTVFFDSANTYPTVKFLLPTADSLQPAAVYVIHPPPPLTEKAAAKRNEVFELVSQKIAAETGPVAVFGDFNSTSWSPQFHDLIISTQLQDSRVTRGIQASWPSFLPGLFRIPIDHVLVSSQVQVESREIQPSVGSDHLPVLTDLLF